MSNLKSRLKIKGKELAKEAASRGYTKALQKNQTLRILDTARFDQDAAGRAILDQINVGVQVEKVLDKTGLGKIGGKSLVSLASGKIQDLLVKRVLGPVVGKVGSKLNKLFGKLGGLGRPAGGSTQGDTGGAGGRRQNPSLEDFYCMLIKMPPSTELFLYVNLESLSIGYADKVKEVSKTIGGVIESNFQDGFDTLSFSGSTGGFMHGEQGYAIGVREQTEAYYTFIRLLSLFKMNADTYSGGDVVDSSLMTIVFLGIEWKGKFTSFEYTESEENPFKFDVNLEFKVYDTFIRV